MAKTIKDLTSQEVLALAIQSEEEDGRIYADLARRIGGDFPATGQTLEAMRAEEDGHRHRLIELYRDRFGEHIPLIRRQDVKGFITRKPLWTHAVLTVAAVRREVEGMEQEARNFYRQAIAQTSDAGVRQLLGDLAAEESRHYDLAGSMEARQQTSGAREQEDESERRRFVLQVVQPGLAGLMDGSVSTLAPVFAAAFASHNSWTAFLVGMAASIGAGISMGFAEALSDDGVLSGRGHPWTRGLVCGAMTTAGRHRAHAAVFDHEFLLCDVRGGRGGRRRTGGDRLDQAPLHGHAAPERHVSGGRGWRARFPRGHPDRLRVAVYFEERFPRWKRLLSKVHW